MEDGGDDHHLEATELRLGLPGTDHKASGGPVPSSCRPNNRKRALPEVVGWPPVRPTFRRNSNVLQAMACRNIETRDDEINSKAAASYVKVSMDGAPFLRKIDLQAPYKGYKDLKINLEGMFSCSLVGDEYVVTYEDKDGDWMMVGDVPWEMFASQCKRLRIMKGWEARGSAASSSTTMST